MTSYKLQAQVMFTQSLLWLVLVHLELANDWLSITTKAVCMFMLIASLVSYWRLNKLAGSEQETLIELLGTITKTEQLNEK